MDCEDRIVAWIEKIYPFLTEDYLLSLTNKGIYKRAHKDLEKIEALIKTEWISEEAVKLTLDEGVSVVLKNPITESQCSCPAQNICRHVMTALIYCKKYYEAADHPGEEETQGEEKEANDQHVADGEANDPEDKEKKEAAKEEVPEIIEGLPELDGLKAKELQKIFGKRLFTEAVKKSEKLGDLVITYGPLTTISKEELFTVYFTKQKTLEQAVCSCKEKGYCVHKLIAIIGYLRQAKDIAITEIKEKYIWTEQTEACICEVKRMITAILDLGLANITEPILQQIEILYIKVYDQKLYELAEELKALASELGLYFTGNVSFSNRNLSYLLAKLFNRAEAMQYHKGDEKKLEELIGTLRAESVEEESATLIGLGSRSFVTKRKDIVSVAYTYCKEHQKVMSISMLRPFDQNILKNVRYLDHFLSTLYKQPIAWQEQRNLEQISQSVINLEHAVLKGEKLSLTTKSNAKLEKSVVLDDIEPYMEESFEKIKAYMMRIKREYFKGYKEKQSLYLVKAYEHSQPIFNKVTQHLEWTVYDRAGEEILFYVPFNALTESMIRRMEASPSKQYLGFLGQFKLNSNTLEAEMYACYDKPKDEEEEG